MQTKHSTLFSILALLLAASFIAPACADPYLGGIPLETVRDGQVSGGLFVDAGFPMSTDASASFSLPAYTAVQWARLYVVVYCGHMQNNYQAQAEVTFNGGRGATTLATELLNVPYTFPGEGGTGPVRLNDHTTRVTSDYLMWYDVKSHIQEKNVLARVKTSRPAGYTGTFDGRVKAIVLVVAYDDGDRDRVVYWVNQGIDEDSERTEEMLGETYVGETSFSTSSLDDEWERADLTVVHLASENAEYEFNRDGLSAGKPQGGYAGIDRHDVTDSIRKGRDSDLTYDNVGRYFKIMLATLAVRYPGSDAGSLKVTSTPPGATIYLDGEEQEAVTNTTLSEVPQGYHIVTVEKEGYRDPGPQQVTVQTGVTSTVHFTLQQGKGTLSVATDPPGAEVLIDGVKQAALTPCVIPDVPAGYREVTMRLSGYQEWKETVEVIDGQTVSIDEALGAGGRGGSSSGGDSTVSGTGLSGYRGSALALYRQGTLNGTFFSTVASDYTGMIPSGRKHVYALPDAVPGGREIVLSRLYLYTTWSHDTMKREGVPASPEVSWNGKLLKADATYTDRKGEGVYDYPVQTFAYDLKGVITPGDRGEVTVVNSGGSGREFAAYGVMLIVLQKDPAAPEIMYWICEGSDIVFADPRFGTTAEDARTRAEFAGNVEKEGIGDATLFLVSTAASGEGGDQHVATFNDGEYYNPLTGGSSGVSVAALDVLPWLERSRNRLEIASLPVAGAGDYMENRNAILVLTRGVPVVAGDAVAPVPGATHAPGATRPAVSLTGGTVQETQTAPEETPLRPTGHHIPPAKETSFPGNIVEWLFARVFDLFGIHRSPSPDAASAGIPVTREDLAIGEESIRADGRDPLFLEPGPVFGDGEGNSVDPPGLEESSSEGATLPGEGDAAPSSPQRSQEKAVTGGIFIDSYPRGADIFIDGRKVPAKTPFVANWLKGGMHSIKLEMESFTFTPESRQVWVTPGEIATAEFSSGATTTRRLFINSTGWPGAQFTVNGRAPVLRIPSVVTVEGISPFVTVFSDGAWHSKTIIARIADGSEVFVENTAEGLAGIEVSSTPQGAQILVDGFNTGKLTPALIGNLSPGQHRVDLLLPGYYPSSQVVTLVDYQNEPVDMRITLAMSPYHSGNLTIESDPPGAKISFFNRDTGRITPATFDYLAIGTVSGRVRWEDAERDFEAVVLPGRTVNLSLLPPSKR
ncbi:MAG: PEGA domain protein [Methanoregulaceae archaeon PtaU1.Bin059]|nr:MAG: PEGA domain protein [Methanoregulaceae archaeon PtaB.Bin152]OPY43465.1 MAG: PEGA domain protein [Methanoregulaceae archaeon PtaU1.Bin059]